VIKVNGDELVTHVWRHYSNRPTGALRCIHLLPVLSHAECRSRRL